MWRIFVSGGRGRCIIARIALIAGAAVAGAFISVATGGLGAFAVGAWATDIIAGATVGAAVGSVLSSVIFPPNQNTSPPMNDLQATSSAAGSPIPWGYGGYRIAGQVIWAQTIKVHKNQQAAQGGKGGGPTTTVYTYTISCALSFGFGPGSITRIWADSKLIYDKTSKGPVAIDTGLQTSNGNAITTPFTPAFYNGTATQPPDPTIQAAEGIGATSGYRDQILMVLTDFPLADYGNRLPNFRAEVTSSTALSYVKDLYPQSNLAGVSGQSDVEYSYVDQVNRVAITLNSSGQVVQKVDLDAATGTPADAWALSTVYIIGNQVLDTNGNIQYCVRNHTSQSSGTVAWQTGETQYTVIGGSNTWQNEGPGPDVSPIVSEAVLAWTQDTSFPGIVVAYGYGSGVDTSGNFWAQGWRDVPGATGWYLLRFNPQTFSCDRQVFIGSGIGHDPGQFPTFTKMKSSNTGKSYLYCLNNSAAGQLLWVLDTGNSSFVLKGTWAIPAYSAPLTAANGNCPPCVDPATGIVYILATQTIAGTPHTGIFAGDPKSGILETVWTSDMTPASWGTPSSNDVGQSLFWDASDSTLIMFTNYGTAVKINSSNGNVISFVNSIISSAGTAITSQTAKGFDCLIPSSGVLPLDNSSGGITFIRTSDLAVVQTLPFSNWMPAIGSSTLDWISYDALTNSVIVTGNTTAYGNFSTRLFLDRQLVASESLQSVVEDIWARTGADPTLLDASALSAIQVQGYPITQQGTGKGLLGPLQAAYFFDMVETDNFFKAVLRGQSVTTVVPEADLGIVSDNYEAVPTIVQEHDLPLFIDVNYYDIALDYQQGKQTYRRNKRAKKTRNHTLINLPLAMRADDAAAISAKCLQTAWAERNQWEFKLWKMGYLVVDPTDVIQFTYNGQTYETRIGKTSVGANKVIEITSVSEDPAQYVTSAAGAPNDGFTSGSIAPIPPSSFYVLDIPFVTDSDNDAPGNTGYYWSMNSATLNPRWPGGILLQSADNTSFNQVGIDTTAVLSGSVPLATPKPKTLWTWDYTTVVNVHVANGGVLTSDTVLNVLNGSNLFYLGLPGSGGEIMAFCNATLQADGSYNLDTLLRGLRGTEGWCGTHGLNETFVSLISGQQRQQQPTTFVGMTQYFRGITFGLPATTSPSQAASLVANDLKPYAPNQFLGVIDGSFNINMSWQRRTRVGGAWLDGIGTVPLSEQSELYEIQIFDSTGTTLKRTVTGITTNSFSYTSAMQVADFGSDQSSVYAVVYQVSASVGPGFPTINPTCGLR